MTDSRQTSDNDPTADIEPADDAADDADAATVEGDHNGRVSEIADHIEALVDLDPAAAADGAGTVVDALARLLEEEDR